MNPAAPAITPPMLRIVLVEPEIPPNTGNVIRLAANTGCELHLIEPLGFSMDDKLLRRAGLDYHEFARVTEHRSWSHWMALMRPDRLRLFAFTSHGQRRFDDVRFNPGDWLVFGSESAGLPDVVRNAIDAEHKLRLPMRRGQRSLNLSHAVAVAVFEAWLYPPLRSRSVACVRLVKWRAPAPANPLPTRKSTPHWPLWNSAESGA